MVVTIAMPFLTCLSMPMPIQLLLEIVCIYQRQYLIKYKYKYTCCNRCYFYILLRFYFRPRYGSIS
jgi:hypothetical protein